MEDCIKYRFADKYWPALSSSYLDTIFKVKLPKGTIYYEGPIGNQGSSYLGGLNYKQIFIESPKSSGIEVIDKIPITGGVK